MEWGTGGENPNTFNPTDLNCEQWVRTFKEAGMKGVIITAKHHDGFCLWPSKYTRHSVKYSKWKNGEGDVIRDLADACNAHGLKLGIYYSPWDRNHGDYGTPQYIDYMRRQLKELLTNYGEIFEVWFDGANGGTGYYGGANEERWVDKRSYYQWENTYKLIRDWQPNAVIFSDAGPDIRWVGNENGYAYETTWSNLTRDSVYGGMPTYHLDWADGQEDGTHWVPAETNVSIRPGWYYHGYEDHKVKSLPTLVDIYYNSIGRNTPLLLNFPVDQRGLVHDADIEALKKMTEKIKGDFSDNVAASGYASATSERGDHFSAAMVIDNDEDTYWCSEDEVTNGSITISLATEITFNRFLAQEYIALGQRIKSFVIEIKQDNHWVAIDTGTTIGYKRILRLEDISTNAVRLTILDAKACPTISNIELYYAEPLLYPPEIKRNKNGVVEIVAADPNTEIFYSMDESEPNPERNKYVEPFLVAEPATIRAIAYDKKTDKKSEVTRMDFDLPKTLWKIISRDTNAILAIDDNDESYWNAPPRERDRIIIDLGDYIKIKGVSYLPPQNRWFAGIISEYALYGCNTLPNWRLLARGEFSNIKNSPVRQKIDIEERMVRYLRLRALKTIDGQPPGFGEIGVVTR